MADGTSSGHHDPAPEPPAAHHDHHPSTYHAGPDPAADPTPPSQSSGPHHKHHPQNGAPDGNEGPSGGIDQQQQNTYGSFDDVERQGQLLPAPQPQDLWPFFFALVVLACFLIFLIVPLVSPS